MNNNEFVEQHIIIDNIIESKPKRMFIKNKKKYLVNNIQL